MAFTVEDFEDMLRILEQNPEWQERMRRAILSRELLELPARLEYLSSLVQQLIEADARRGEQIAELAQSIRELRETVQRHTETLQRHDERITALEQVVQELKELTQRNTEILQRHDNQIAELAQVVRELAEAQRRTEARLERLDNRVEGEIGRRSGERYEREVVADAPTIFYGGDGGSPGDPMVRNQLRQWLQPLFEQGVEITPFTSPFRADIIWWKGDRVMVVGIGIKVSRDDVNRAVARAELLRQAGVNATPAVIGEEWGLPDIQALAQREGVEWLVGDGLSQGFLEFRRLPDGLQSARSPL
jgi:phage shock protein A